MTDTREIQKLTPDAYVDAYSVSGIAAGTDINIHNQSGNTLRIHVGSSQPPADSRRYLAFPADLFVSAYVEGIESGCWLLGEGDVLIQEA